jgi:para-nitrobenzyl esterase
MTVIRITGGVLRGAANGGVHRFLGVPFAQAPAGPLRWRPPIPVTPWSGERDATAYGPVNQQPALTGSFRALSPDPARIGDDCLNLNVWTADPGATGLPVLVWIHGGAFYAGSGSDEVYDGSAFARDGVVAVTINYRLGAHGFLHLDQHFPELATRGSLGMHDQLAALRWVHDNIAAFGGDPGRVTVAGESAGAMSVAALLASPARHGLFQRVVVQSSPGAVTASPHTATRIGGYLLDALGIEPGDVAALAAVDPLALQAAEMVIIEEAQTAPTPERFAELAAAPMPFVPVHGTELLPDRPIDAIAAGAAADVAVLIGSNTEESLIFFAGVEDTVTEELVEAAVPAEAAKRYRDRLSGGNRLVRPHEILAAAGTDRTFRVPTYRLADELARHNQDVWAYEFAWRSPVPGFGAGHFIEVPFVFDTVGTAQGRAFVGDDPAADLADLAGTVHRAWVAFVSGGQPGSAGLPDWEPWTPGEPRLMVLDRSARSSGDPRPAETRLWEGAS